MSENEETESPYESKYEFRLILLTDEESPSEGYELLNSITLEDITASIDIDTLYLPVGNSGEDQTHLTYDRNS